MDMWEVQYKREIGKWLRAQHHWQHSTPASAPGSHLILVMGQLGCGKTTAIADYMREAERTPILPEDARLFEYGRFNAHRMPEMFTGLTPGHASWDPLQTPFLFVEYLIEDETPEQLAEMVHWLAECAKKHSASFEVILPTPRYTRNKAVESSRLWSLRIGVSDHPWRDQ